MSLFLFFVDALKLLIVLVSPLCQLWFGRWLVGKLADAIGANRQDVLDDGVHMSCAAFVIGLLCHLLLCFFLKCWGAPWLVAFALPLTPLLFLLIQRKKIFTGVKVPPSFNYSIWFFVTFALGLCLIDTLDGIHTPWKNNYGDFTFHAGMISSWVLGDNFPPEYHIFPGVSLSYPVLMNIWTASLWWLSPTWNNLSLLFLFQWLILWTIIFFTLRGDKYWFLPWALLLGGGSYFALGENSGELISKQAPWAVFLTTIWVTQRTALLGMAALLTSLWAFHRSLSGEQSQSTRRFYIALSCITLALSPLAHTHITLVGMLYVGFVLLYRFFFLAISQVLFKREVAEGNVSWTRAFGEGLLAITFLIPAIHALPWILGKSGMTKLIPGWFTVAPPDGASIWKLMGMSLEMWYQNAGVWVVCMLLVWALTRKHLFFLAMLSIFLFGNVVQLAEWNWDQIKIFIALYATFLAFWSQIRNTDAWMAHFLSIFLMIPAMYESYKVFNEGQNYSIYSKEEVAQAGELTRLLDPSAIIAGAPRHNSLVTLSGRDYYYGYEGTLSSHALPYLPRREMMQSLDALANCKETQEITGTCPTHILWTKEEEKHWKRRLPGKQYKRTALPYLYEAP